MKGQLPQPIAGLVLAKPVPAACCSLCGELHQVCWLGPDHCLGVGLHDVCQLWVDLYLHTAQPAAHSRHSAAAVLLPANSARAGAPADQLNIIST